MPFKLNALDNRRSTGFRSPVLNLSTPEAARILRALLATDNAARKWTQRDLRLHARPNVSIGLVNKVGPGPQGHRAQPTLGGRHHLYRNQGRLALFSRHSGPLQSQDRGLGYERAHRHRSCSKSSGDGPSAPQPSSQSALPYRPRRPIRQWQLSSSLGQAGLIASMSRRGNCYDNATMESFWATLKLELVYRRRFENRAQARSQIFDYIEMFYNRQRAHSALDYHSPVDFEIQNN